MKKLAIIITVIASSCSNPHEKHIQLIKDDVKRSFLGADVNFICDHFEWVDTLTTSELVEVEITPRIERLTKLFDSTYYYVTDNFKEGYVFGKEYLTRERIRELVNYENNKRGVDYLTFAKENAGSSDFIESFNYHMGVLSGASDPNPNLWRTLAWMYSRIDGYNLSQSGRGEMWGQFKDSADVLIKLESERRRMLQSDDIIWKMSDVEYHINNPFMNSAKQDVEAKYYFNSSDSIILVE